MANVRNQESLEGKRELRCPTCKGKVAERAENPSYPFCSERCKAVDLARWFTGSYAVPGPSIERRRNDDDLDS